MKGKRLTEAQKGKMARDLVYYCISVLSITALWALILKTVSIVTGNAVDLSDVLSFVGAAFGGELLLLLLKRILSKPREDHNNE